MSLIAPDHAPASYAAAALGNQIKTKRTNVQFFFTLLGFQLFYRTTFTHFINQQMYNSYSCPYSERCGRAREGPEHPEQRDNLQAALGLLCPPPRPSTQRDEVLRAEVLQRD